MFGPIKMQNPTNQIAQRQTVRTTFGQSMKLSMATDTIKFKHFPLKIAYKIDINSELKAVPM